MPTARHLKGINVLLFLTDQQRAIQHFPKGWAKSNLPGDEYLVRHGLTFPAALNGRRRSNKNTFACGSNSMRYQKRGYNHYRMLG